LFFVDGQPVGSLGYRYRPEREVDMVFDFGFVGVLAVGQSGKLFCITKKEFDLKSEAKSLQYPFPIFVCVGAEIKFVALRGAIRAEVFHRD
jgi:hypothetical protein